MKIFKNKEGKQIFLSALLLVIVMALYIEFNVLMSKINFKEIDITEQKVYTLSAEAKDRIGKIDKDVNISLYDFEKYGNYMYTDDVVRILNQVDEASDKIHIELNESEKNENKIPYMIFTCGDNSRKISLNELISYKYITAYGAQDEIYFIEPMIVNSIENVENQNNKKIYICLEKSVYNENMFTSFINIAGIMGIDTYSMDFSVDNKVPDDCVCLVIPPLANISEMGEVSAVDFSDEEREIIEKYISNGGNILFLQESKSVVQGETPNLDYLMSLYGASISDGIVFQEENIIQDFPSYIYANINSNNNILRMTNLASKICVFDSGIINIVDENEKNNLNINQNILLKTNKKSFLRNDLKNNSSVKNDNDIELSDAPLGIYVEKNNGENKSKAIIYSSSIFVSNNPIGMKDIIANNKLAVEAALIDENQDLIADTIYALVDKDDTIFYKKTKYNIVPASGLINDGITIKIIFVIPMIILFIGYIVWRHRKNKI